MARLRTKALAARLDVWWQAGRAAWADIPVARSVFHDFAAERDVDPELAADVYLACACALQIPAALDAFEASVGASLDRAIRRASHDSAQWDDLKQIVRERIFVNGKAGPAKITSYSGRAPLLQWARVVAVRAVRSAQRKRFDTPVEDGIFRELIEERTAEDAVLELHLVRAYKAAFERAFAKLTPAERTLMRLSVVDGLGIDSLARLLNVHRATAARRLVATRQKLVRDMTTHVRRDARLTQSEAASAIRLIGSKIDLSLERVMGADDVG
jgi:RNA polymerase sigma-70 factor (ECF subfamily)